MEITKNRQSEDTLRKMALRAFPGKQMESAAELTEGAYREYEDDGVYQWAKPMLELSWKEIAGRESSL